MADYTTILVIIAFFSVVFGIPMLIMAYHSIKEQVECSKKLQKISPCLLNVSADDYKSEYNNNLLLYEAATSEIKKYNMNFPEFFNINLLDFMSKNGEYPNAASKRRLQRRLSKMRYRSH